jgi:hypothetical protein
MYKRYGLNFLPSYVFGYPISVKILFLFLKFIAKFMSLDVDRTCRSV